jgi:hypothetical protein
MLPRLVSAGVRAAAAPVGIPPMSDVARHEVQSSSSSADGGRYAWRDSATSPDNTLFNQLWPRRMTRSAAVVPLHGWAGNLAVRAPGVP